MRLTGLTLPILLGALLIQVVTVVMKPGTKPRPHLESLKEQLKYLPGRGMPVIFKKREPEVIKEGECPTSPTPPTACLRRSNTENGNCTGDQHCYGAQKCCPHDCKNMCKEPAVGKPGTKQRPHLESLKESLKEPLPEKYLPGRGMPVIFKQREPAVIKEGVCPEPPIHYSICLRQSNTENGNCTGDQHCYGKQKCCLHDDCKNMCKDPAVMKPGKCAEHPITPSACAPWLLEGGCRSDQECDGAKKCCMHECRHKCRDPVE